MASITKVLSILDIFTREKPLWTVEEIQDKFSFSQPQTYRYLKELCDSRLLAKFKNHYMLGSKIIEFDATIRICDPLLTESFDILENINKEYDIDVSLASMYGLNIITTAHISGPESKNIIFGRGVRLPLLSGANSKAILSSLNRRQQLQAFNYAIKNNENSSNKILEEQFLENLKEIRKNGFAVSIEELAKEQASIAIPFASNFNLPPSCISVIMSKKRFNTTNTQVIVNILEEARNKILKRIN